MTSYNAKPAQKSATALKARSGARILVDALVAHGFRQSFGVPGESFLAVLDALRDSPIDFVICRQEGGAAMMAEAAGKLTGRPGLCFVTRGPGATNASAGVHIAQQDSTPMILFVGDIAREFCGREAFQEMDHEKVFGTIAKWAVSITDAARIPEVLARAIRVATQGRPGPVVISLPEDMLVDEVTVEDAAPVEPDETRPGLADMMRMQKMLHAASCPIVLLGGSRWSEKSAGMFRRFAERLDLPVAVSFRRQMLFPGDHENYAGELGLGPNPKLIERIKASDLVLAIGTRLGEIPSQAYELFGIPDPGVPMVHVHASADELGRVYQPALGIHASPNAFAASLEGVEPPREIKWKQWRKDAREDYLGWSEQVPANVGPVQMRSIIQFLRGLPADSIFCNGAGNFSVWLHRFNRYKKFGTQLAPVSGSMGYGVPAAIAAKHMQPEKTVVAFCGDGDFLMTGQELATAAQYNIAVKFIVIDNGTYGTIRMHQEKHYPGRVSATTLKNPDFAAYAKAFGGHGERVKTTEEFAPAFERAVASGKPAIIHCLLDPEAITPAKSLSTIRAEALEAQGKG